MILSDLRRKSILIPQQNLHILTVRLFNCSLCVKMTNIFKYSQSQTFQKKILIDINKYTTKCYSYFSYELIGGVMVSMLTSSAVDWGSSPGRVKRKTRKLVFVASPEWSDMSTHGLLFQCASTIKTQLSVLV